MDDETLGHYIDSFTEAARLSAISYYRDGLSFYRVDGDSDSESGESYSLVTDAEMAAMWMHPGGLESHPEHARFLDFAPEDRAKRFPGRALFMYSAYFATRFLAGGKLDPDANPFAGQYARYFPHLETQAVENGH